MALHNKPLVPTRNGEAPLLAAQRRRYAGRKMKIAVSAMWLSESSGVVFGIPFAGPQCAASAASSSQLSRYVFPVFDACYVISPATVARGGARQSKARALRQPLPRKGSCTSGVVARACSRISGYCTSHLPCRSRGFA